MGIGQHEQCLLAVTGDVKMDWNRALVQGVPNQHCISSVILDKEYFNGSHTLLDDSYLVDSPRWDEFQYS